MRKVDVIRAWKDEAYRDGLSETERALLPENPAGLVELTDEQLGGAAGIGPIGLATEIMSCFPTCGVSIIIGTCRFWSTGCPCEV